MDSWDKCFTEEFFANVDAIHAIQDDDYDKYFEIIRNVKGTFTDKDAQSLCKSLIMHSAPLEAFEAALEHCPPLEEFCYYPDPDFLGGKRMGLLENAVYHDRTDIVEFLLDKGLKPEADETRASLQEVIARGCSAKCEELLRLRELI